MLLRMPWSTCGPEKSARKRLLYKQLSRKHFRLRNLLDSRAGSDGDVRGLNFQKPVSNPDGIKPPLNSSGQQPDIRFEHHITICFAGWGGPPHAVTHTRLVIPSQPFTDVLVSPVYAFAALDRPVVTFINGRSLHAQARHMKYKPVSERFLALRSFTWALLTRRVWLRTILSLSCLTFVSAHYRRTCLLG